MNLPEKYRQQFYRYFKFGVVGTIAAVVFLVLLYAMVEFLGIPVLIATSIAFVVWLAMLPGKIAFKREHSQAEAIRMAGWLMFRNTVRFSCRRICRGAIPAALSRKTRKSCS